MKSSQLHCFGNGSLDFLPANFMVGIAAAVVMVFKDLRGSSSSSHEQMSGQSRTYEPRENYTYVRYGSDLRIHILPKRTKRINMWVSNGWISFADRKDHIQCRI